MLRQILQIKTIIKNQKQKNKLNFKVIQIVEFLELEYRREQIQELWNKLESEFQFNLGIL